MYREINNFTPLCNVPFVLAYQSYLLCFNRGVIKLKRAHFELSLTFTLHVYIPLKNETLINCELQARIQKIFPWGGSNAQI